MESAGLKNVKYIPANANEQIQIESESFDVVFMVNVLGEVKNQEFLLGEVYRLLRRGGILSISEHLPDPDFVSVTLTTFGCRSLWESCVNFSKKTVLFLTGNSGEVGLIQLILKRCNTEIVKLW